jgi:hypothetical protein
MKRLIVGSLEALSFVAIILTIVGGAIWGYRAVSASHNFAYALGGGLLGALVGFVIATITFGTLLTLLEMNEHLRAIRGAMQFSPDRGRREPTF